MAAKRPLEPVVADLRKWDQTRASLGTRNALTHFAHESAASSRFHARLSRKAQPGRWEPICVRVNNPGNVGLVGAAFVLHAACPAAPVPI
jgi:hypothetical protein